MYAVVILALFAAAQAVPIGWNTMGLNTGITGLNTGIYGTGVYGANTAALATPALATPGLVNPALSYNADPRLSTIGYGAGMGYGAGIGYGHGVGYQAPLLGAGVYGTGYPVGLGAAAVYGAGYHGLHHGAAWNTAGLYGAGYAGLPGTAYTGAWTGAHGLAGHGLAYSTDARLATPALAGVGMTGYGAMPGAWGHGMGYTGMGAYNTIGLGMGRVWRK